MIIMYSGIIGKAISIVLEFEAVEYVAAVNRAIGFE